MAKKTKKQKIIAGLRRQIHLNQVAASTSFASHSQNDTISFTLPHSKKPQITSTIPGSNPAFLYRDLAKTALVAASLFAVQFFLYWVFERGGDKVLAPLLMK